jgi:Leucine-rich repeat (LRR) protein
VREFIINENLLLRLEYNKTVIYVDKKRFLHCKFVILTIPIDEITALEEITSVDEAIETLDTSLEPLENNDEKLRKLIEPETEFWAHCSNLQAWYENGYDTRLLHMNLAFPLLHELAKAGEKVAKSVFKEEIAKRLTSGYPSVVNYLFNEGYVNFLNSEELLDSILEPEEAKALLDIERITQHKYHRVEDVKYLREELDEEGVSHFVIQNRKVIGLDLSYEVGSFPKSIVNLNDVKVLYLDILDKIEVFPEEITYMKSLEQLIIYFGELSKVREIPESIGNLSGLKKLSLFEGYLDTLPSSIGNLERLEVLIIHMPNLSTLPETIGRLKSLQFLEILDCSFTALPFSISSLKSLKKLVIENKLINKTTMKSINSLQFSKSKDYGTSSKYQK